jgi:hypothetical protein
MNNTRKRKKKKKTKTAWRCSSKVECLPSMWKALNLIPTHSHNKKKFLKREGGIKLCPTSVRSQALHYRLSEGLPVSTPDTGENMSAIFKNFCHCTKWRQT